LVFQKTTEKNIFPTIMIENLWQNPHNEEKLHELAGSLSSRRIFYGPAED
jgi:hypothetical protein